MDNESYLVLLILVEISRPAGRATTFPKKLTERNAFPSISFLGNLDSLVIHFEQGHTLALGLSAHMQLFDAIDLRTASGPKTMQEFRTDPYNSLPERLSFITDGVPR